ncbi:hypothetical protein Tco_0137400, partial [Tanacetum coccineum]
MLLFRCYLILGLLQSKARTTLLQSIPDDHVADFHYMDDARDIWNAVKDRFGGNAESKKMRKSMLKQEFSEFRIGDAGEFALMGVTSETRLGDDVQAVPPPIPETIPETRHESDHSQDHLSTPIRQQATPHVAPVFEHGQRTDPHIASSIRVHETEDDSLGGFFHVSPPRFTQASPTGHALGGAE